MEKEKGRKNKGWRKRTEIKRRKKGRKEGRTERKKNNEGQKEKIGNWGEERKRKERKGEESKDERKEWKKKNCAKSVLFSATRHWGDNRLTFTNHSFVEWGFTIPGTFHLSHRNGLTFLNIKHNLSTMAKKKNQMQNNL